METRPGGIGTDRCWRRRGQGTAAVPCFSFYANETIATWEGGMAVTDDLDLADRIRFLSQQGLSHIAWNRRNRPGGWDYKFIAPSYQYNVTDVAAEENADQPVPVDTST